MNKIDELKSRIRNNTEYGYFQRILESSGADTDIIWGGKVIGCKDNIVTLNINFLYENDDSVSLSLVVFNESIDNLSSYIIEDPTNYISNVLRKLDILASVDVNAVDIIYNTEDVNGLGDLIELIESRSRTTDKIYSKVEVLGNLPWIPGTQDTVVNIDEAASILHKVMYSV